MTTTGQRLAFLSGLSGVSAAEHLKKIAGTIGVAGALLVIASGLNSGTAEQHLAREKPKQEQTYNYGSGGSGSYVHGSRTRQERLALEQAAAKEAKRKQIEEEAIIMACVQFVLEQT